MPYCTKQDMIDRFSEQELIELTDRDNLGDINDTVIAQAIDDASAEIDGYLVKYTLPLVVVPRVLIRANCDIARYFLYDDEASEQVIRRYEAIIKYLTQVSKGVINIGPDASGEKPQANDGAIVQSGGRIFGRSDNGFL